MKWIKIIFKPVIWLFDDFELVSINCHNTSNNRKNNNRIKINPSTGLPMIGSLDSLGNSFGSSASDRSSNVHTDYHHQSSTYTSSYDPFSNRY